MSKPEIDGEGAEAVVGSAAPLFAAFAALLGSFGQVSISITPKGFYGEPPEFPEVEGDGEGIPARPMRAYAGEADLGSFATAQAIARFALDQAVRLEVTGNAGKILAITHYANGAPPRYLVRFARDGHQLEDWFDEDALDAAAESDGDDRPARPSR